MSAPARSSSCTTSRANRWRSRSPRSAASPRLAARSGADGRRRRRRRRRRGAERLVEGARRRDPSRVAAVSPFVQKNPQIAENRREHLRLRGAVPRFPPSEPASLRVCRLSVFLRVFRRSHGSTGGRSPTPGEVTLCHKVNVTIRVSTRALPAHEAHGDRSGPALPRRAPRSEGQARPRRPRPRRRPLRMRPRPRQAESQATAQSQQRPGQGEGQGQASEDGAGP